MEPKGNQGVHEADRSQGSADPSRIWDTGARARARRLAALRRIEELKALRTRFERPSASDERDLLRATRALAQARLRAMQARTSSLLAHRSAAQAHERAAAAHEAAAQLSPELREHHVRRAQELREEAAQERADMGRESKWRPQGGRHLNA